MESQGNEAANRTSSSQELGDAAYRSLFKALPGPCAALAPDLRIVACNDAFLAATLATAAQVVGRRLQDVLPTEGTGEALADSLGRVLRTAKSESMPLRRLRVPAADGGGSPEERCYLPTTHPVVGDDGRVILVLHHLADVSGPGSRETELLDRNDELRRQDRMKAQLFANASHELRTPLTLVLGPLEKLLGTGGLPQAARRELEVAARNGRSLLRHVNDLLDLARLEADRLKVHYEDVDLASLLMAAAAQFEGLASDRRVELRVDAPGAVDAHLDPGKVERVLCNLLSNAFKFTPEGGRVHCTLTHRSGNGSPERACVAVENTGKHIPPDRRERIFQRYAQADSSAQRRGGAGLGLSIAKDLVELHGGSIAVEDGPEGGARFVVHLPLRAPAGASVRPRKVAKDWPPARAARLSPDASALRPTVLVVEDDRDTNDFLCRILAQRYRPVPAFDGAEGLRLARELVPDLVLTDVMMPSLSGRTLVAALHASLGESRPPIVVLSGKTDDDTRAQVLRSGADDYVTKPFSVHELHARIEHLLAARKIRSRLIVQAKLQAAHPQEPDAAPPEGDEEDLRRQHDHLASILEALPEGVIACDRDGRVTLANRAARDLLAGDGATWLKDDAPTVPADHPMRRALRDGEATGEETQGQGRTGGLAFSIRVIRDGDGSLQGALATLARRP